MGAIEVEEEQAAISAQGESGAVAIDGLVAVGHPDGGCGVASEPTPTLKNPAVKVLSGEVRTSDSSSTNREDPLFKEEGEVMVDEEEEGSSRDGRTSRSSEDRREVGIGKMGLGMFAEAEWSLHK